ncbi:hypothetical protein E3N88_27971 [Mikania micrantha]|uniref:Uncharacterized protein n=1 Tax=Mikania micrantha TaxID=192012 RepID=A0A5N6MZB5_9ASTR|nr:hypothetical protein E3N88_27971 [Mikania micrantha]
MVEMKIFDFNLTLPAKEQVAQLIQLSGDSDADLCHRECEASTTKRRRKEIIIHDDESQRSSTSDATSVGRYTTPWWFHDDGIRSRKRKKFRSVAEIYQVSNS